MVGKNGKLTDEKLAHKLKPLIKKVIKANVAKAKELKVLFSFLTRLEHFDNAMLSHIWGPCLLRPRFSCHDIEKVMVEQKAINRIVKVLLGHCKQLFHDSDIWQSLKKQRKLLSSKMYNPNFEL